MRGEIVGDMTGLSHSPRTGKGYPGADLPGHEHIDNMTKVVGVALPLWSRGKRPFPGRL